MHISLNDNRCTGCSACFNICPQNCITMKYNSEGFIYPDIENNKCIECGLCKNVCLINNKSMGCSYSNAYACYSLNDDAVLDSSSGGMFYEIATNILNRGGYVCGAEYFENCNVRHVLIDNKKELRKLMKSKYIESSLDKIYCDIKKILNNNTCVLFMGTPCQVKGLKLFLKHDYENLFCGEVVCHGVPSYKVLRSYIDYLSEGSKIKQIDFRNKEYGWNNYSIKIEFENNQIINMKREDCLFFSGFVNNLFLRPSCYSCECKIQNTYADFTLGDFWGVDEVMPDINNNKGISLYISHSDKGNELIKALEDNIFYRELNDCSYMDFNPSIVKSSSENKKRDLFFYNIDKYDFGLLWDYVYSTNAFYRKQLILKNKFKQILSTKSLFIEVSSTILSIASKTDFGKGSLLPENTTLHFFSFKNSNSLLNVLINKFIKNSTSFISLLKFSVEKA